MAYGPAPFCLLLGLLGLLPAAAQAPKHQTIDKIADGIRFDLPSDWALDNRPFRGPGGAEGLVRAGSLNGRQAIQVFLFEAAAAQDFDAWMLGFRQSLETIPGIVRIEPAATPSISKPAKLLLARAELVPDHIDTSYLCIQLAPDTVVTMALSGAAVSEDAGTPLRVADELNRLVASLQIYFDGEWAVELPFARRRGLQFVKEQLPAAIRGVRLDPQPRTYLLEVGGQPRGYRTMHFRPERHSMEDPAYGNTRGEPGLRVQENEWHFVGQQASFEVWDSFSSVSGKTGLYEHTRSETAQVGGVFTAPYVIRDECIRAGDQLVTSFTTTLQLALPQPQRPFALGRDYLGLGWVRAMAALVPAQQTEWICVQAYAPSVRDVVPFAIRCTGEIPSEEGPPNRRYQCRWGHGPLIELTTDAYGNPIEWSEGPNRYTLIPAEEAERRFAQQRETARPRLSNVKKENGD